MLEGMPRWAEWPVIIIIYFCAFNARSICTLTMEEHRSKAGMGGGGLWAEWQQWRIISLRLGCQPWHPLGGSASCAPKPSTCLCFPHTPQCLPSTLVSTHKIGRGGCRRVATSWLRVTLADTQNPSVRCSEYMLQGPSNLKPV